MAPKEDVLVRLNGAVISPYGSDGDDADHRSHDHVVDEARKMEHSQCTDTNQKGKHWSNFGSSSSTKSLAAGFVSSWSITGHRVSSP